MAAIQSNLEQVLVVNLGLSRTAMPLNAITEQLPFNITSFDDVTSNRIK